MDQEQPVESAMREILGGRGWAGLDLLDLGCGTGFHLPRWAVEGTGRCTGSSRTRTWPGLGGDAVRPGWPT